MRARELGLRIARPSKERPRQTAAQAHSTDALANQAGRGGVMGMPGQGMATAGAPVKERGQKGPSEWLTGQGKARQNRPGPWPLSTCCRAPESLDPSRLHTTYCEEKKTGGYPGATPARFIHRVSLKSVESHIHQSWTIP